MATKVDDPQAGDDRPAEFKTSGELTWKEEGTPLSYFQSMYASHVYLATTTWGDVYRIFKYFRLFQEWDDRRGSRLFLVYPNQFTELDLQHYEGTFYAKEKDIVNNMVISFRENKESDRVTYDLPIDFLTFARYFAFQGLVQVLGRQNQGELIPYRTLYFIYQKMGMFPYNGDVNLFTKSLNQGMNSFEAMDDVSLPTGSNKMVNGWQAFMAAQVRSARQIAAKFYFNDDEKSMGVIGYQNKKRKRRANKKH